MARDGIECDEIWIGKGDPCENPNEVCSQQLSSVPAQPPATCHDLQ